MAVRGVGARIALAMLPVVCACDSRSNAVWSMSQSDSFLARGWRGTVGRVSWEIQNPTRTQRELVIELGAGCREHLLIVEGADPPFEGKSCEALRFRLAAGHEASVALYGKSRSRYEIKFLLE